MLQAISNTLDNFLMVCCDVPDLDKLIDQFALFNRIFGRWIYTTDGQETEFSLNNGKIIWEESSVDREHVANINNYRDMSDYPHKRQFMLSKACNVFDVLVDQLKLYSGSEIILKELRHLL